MRGHVARMREMGNTYKTLLGKAKEQRQSEKPIGRGRMMLELMLKNKM